MNVCLQKRNTLLVCCAAGQVLEIEGPAPDAHDPVHTFEITNLPTRTHQFKSVKSVLLVRHPLALFALKSDTAVQWLKFTCWGPGTLKMRRPLFSLGPRCYTTAPGGVTFDMDVFSSCRQLYYIL